MAMGGAYTAVVNDATSLYYNPGGLGNLQGRQISLLYAKLFGDANYQYLSYAQNWRKKPGGWGLEVLKLGVSGISGRDSLNNQNGDFAYGETGLGLGMGWRGFGFPELSLGLRAKMLRRQLANSSDSLMGLDVGTQYGPIVGERLMLGLTLQNVLRQAKGDTSDTLRPIARLGAAYRIAGALLLSADVTNTQEFSLGTEYILGIAALRVGVQHLGPSFGAGVVFRQAYALDFALVQNQTLGMTQRLSLGYRFGAGKKRARREEATAQEYLSSAEAELANRQYLRASRAIDMALGLNPRLGDGGWKARGKRLKALVAAMEFAEHPELEEDFRKKTPQADLGHRAVMAFLEGEDAQAMLLGHAAQGQDPQEPRFQALLQSLSGLTRLKVDRESLLPAQTLAERRLQDLAKAVYARRFEAAARAGRDAVLLDPENVMAWKRLGSAYFAAGDLVNAKACYREALRRDMTDEKLREFMRQHGMTE